jgi:23S rRNA-/tRNA-specific pseudouridylate synthase
VKLWDGDDTAVVLVMPVTDRRHQIRVHLAWIGHAIVGDPFFFRISDSTVPRTLLHSWSVAFDLPSSAKRIVVFSGPDVGFWETGQKTLRVR